MQSWKKRSFNWVLTGFHAWQEWILYSPVRDCHMKGRRIGYVLRPRSGEHGDLDWGQDWPRDLDDQQRAASIQIGWAHDFVSQARELRESATASFLVGCSGVCFDEWEWESCESEIGTTLLIFAVQSMKLADWCIPGDDRRLLHRSTLPPMNMIAFDH